MVDVLSTTIQAKAWNFALLLALPELIIVCFGVYILTKMLSKKLCIFLTIIIIFSYFTFYGLYGCKIEINF